MSSGGVNRTAVGNSTNKQLDTISTGGNEFNTQLQGLLGQASRSPLATAGADANAGYKDLSVTGGYTPEQISALKNEGSDAARSAYATAGDSYKRAVMASGGYGPSAATTEMLARHGSQAAEHAAVGTDAAIAQSQVQNRIAGLSGQAGLAGLNQQQIQSLLATLLGNKSDTNNATNQTLGIQQNIAAQPGAFSRGIQNAATLIGAVSGGINAGTGGRGF